jgi:homocysteine S-methyltransferase
MDGLDGEAGRKMGIEIAKELIDTIMAYFNGIYLMTPFLLYEMSVQLTNYVWEKSNRIDFHLYPLSK